jgi:hypothetical protein
MMVILASLMEYVSKILIEWLIGRILKDFLHHKLTYLSMAVLFSLVYFLQVMPEPNPSIAPLKGWLLALPTNLRG